MSTTAQFSEIPFTNTVVISGTSAANTAKDGSGTVGTNMFLLCTAGTNGARVDKISFVACGTLVANTAGTIRIFLSSATGATGKLLWREYAAAAITPTAAVVGANNFATRVIDGGLILKAGQSVYCTSHFADTAGNQFAVTVEGGDF